MVNYSPHNFIIFEKKVIMRKAIVYVHNNRAGVLMEVSPTEYYFEFDNNYLGNLVLFRMLVIKKIVHKNTKL